MEPKTLLLQKFTFSLTYFEKEKNKQLKEFEDNYKDISTFDTVEDFWTLYEHTKKPSELTRGNQFFFFKNNIRPLWEDEKNLQGGRFFLSLKKSENCNKIWEELLVNFIGISPEMKINGLVLNIRTSEVIISIWIESCTEEIKNSIKEWILNNLNLPNDFCLQFKKHPNSEDLNNLQIQLDKKEIEEEKKKNKYKNKNEQNEQE